MIVFGYNKVINTKTWKDAPFTWINMDLSGVYTPHYDLVMITTQIGLWRVARY